jgi:type IV secretion system protein VirB11
MSSRDELPVRRLLASLQPFLDRDDVLEIIMNRPGEVFVESATGGWERHEVSMDSRQCRALAVAVATYFDDDINEAQPLLSASLPGGERVQFVIPPAVPRDTVSITIRRPSRVTPRLADLEASGLFARVVDKPNQIQQHEMALLELMMARRYAQFLLRAVQLRKTIVISGQTGAGKTHILKALAEEIGHAERLVTIESVPEILLPSHPNAVHLFYSDAGKTKTTPKELLKAALRMRPDRILLTEVRSDECIFWVRAAASGHPGSMTTLHAGSCTEAYEQMALMIRQAPGGAGLTDQEIKRLLTLTVDIVIQFGNDGTGRYVREIDYDPQRKLALAHGGRQ